jgi:hypothetical protein
VFEVIEMNKIIYAIFAAGIILPLSSKAIIQCPGSKQIESVSGMFVTDIKPVPFPQCMYLAKAAHSTKVNHCDQIQKKLSKLSDLTMKNWECYFFPDQENNYHFTFYPAGQTTK